MKVTVNTLGFAPITLTVTLENKSELLDLYHRINMSTSNVRKSAKGDLVPYNAVNSSDTMPLFDVLEPLVEPYKVK